RMSSTTFDKVSCCRPASTTLAPRPAAIRAVAAPMPLPAPVITMTWSRSGFRFGFIEASWLRRPDSAPSAAQQEAYLPERDVLLAPRAADALMRRRRIAPYAPSILPPAPCTDR